MDVTTGDVREAVLGEADVARLLEDLAAHAEVLEVTARTGAGDLRIALAEVAGAIASRSVRAVRIRYVYEGTTWVDTIMLATGAIRLVRMALPGHEDPPCHDARPTP